MSRTLTTISLDPTIKKEAVGILKSSGISLSFFIEQSLRKLIDETNNLIDSNNQVERRLND